MLVLLTCIKTEALESDATCKELVPKKPPFAKPKEPLVQEISINCINQSANRAIPGGATEEVEGAEKKGKKENDQTSSQWLKFFEEIVKLLGSFSWPIAAVLIASFFKKELATLLTRLKKGKLGSAEFEFDAYVREIDAEADFPRTSETESMSPSAALRASTDPRGAVISAWLEVEDELFKLVGRSDVAGNMQPQKHTKNSVWAIRVVQKARMLDANWIALFHDLRSLRNEAAHLVDFSPSPEAVFKYVQLAKELSTAMRLATPEE